MTRAEHKLVITMFKEQQATIAALIEILKVRGILQNGDLDAHALALRDSGTLRLIEDRVEEVYRGNAANLGILTSDLPSGTY